MTDTPIPSIVTKVENDIKWIRAHAIIAILAVALIAGSIIGGISLFEGLVAKHDAQTAAAQQAQLTAVAAVQAAFAKQLEQEHQDNLVRDAQQTALIQTLVTQMAQSRAVTTKQVAKDSTLDARAAADRLVQQTKSTPTDVTVSNDLVTMTLPLTRIVVADLDLLPQAQSDVTNLQGQLDAQKILTSDAKVELSTANQVILADKTELIDTIKSDNAACTVRVDQQASKDRKRGFWASLASFVAGVGLGYKL